MSADPSGPVAGRRPRGGRVLVALAAFVLLALLQFHQPPRFLFAERSPVPVPPALVDARPAPDAFGRSGHVAVRFAFPGEVADFPIEIQGDPSRVTYAWEPVGDTLQPVASTLPRPIGTGQMVAPDAPGFYRLVLSGGGYSRRIETVSLGVMVPFGEKRGSRLNGYLIGTYRGERSRASEPTHPDGFIEIRPEYLELPLTAHLTVGDFVTHDGQETWPRYAALDTRLLDKIELVIDEIASWHGGQDRLDVTLDVHSGFRTPLYNRRVPRSALDSRHQFGDAADLAIDANADGQLNLVDARLVSLAVEIVEREHPDLVGGLGLYALGGQSYVHVDARGTRARWQG
ncbi:MAG TPA: hypothetical protein VFG84_11625 [Gemmatimonadaceae bacterium]|nr:hypothetical protein [Gemmatimonadaceae bacterium]